ncbi:antitoxin [Devosia ginsengisoli]|uniref:antitoxin n=1 Tax=Devosia ginsengisoli TaxID=400770 RepID=UPI0026E9AEF4|nr:AbrB/MazE/SpoVT family DNA-binding domain-containing protein [Devosia ginsengisoli]MCR6673489.1 AbrB/MazE/SpoVT family DNA-binding domain-containing protein [Devosia ginsengisoli]
MNEIKIDRGQTRTASLFRNGRNQAVRIPVEFELPGTEVTITKDGDRLVVEPKVNRKKTFLDVVAEYGPVDFPDIDDSDLLPLDEPQL